MVNSDNNNVEERESRNWSRWWKQIHQAALCISILNRYLIIRRDVVVIVVCCWCCCGCWLLDDHRGRNSRGPFVLDVLCLAAMLLTALSRLFEDSLKRFFEWFSRFSKILRDFRRRWGGEGLDDPRNAHVLPWNLIPATYFRLPAYKLIPPDEIESARRPRSNLG